MNKETAGQTPKLSNVMFKVTEQHKAAFKIMCAELDCTQQEMLAAMVQLLVTEHKRQPESVRSIVEEARKTA